MRIACWLSVALGLLLLLAPAHRAAAEMWPGPGTYEGVYHEDRWGRARVSFFVVPDSLQKRFAPFEGKRIRFEVTRGSQMTIPGPVHLEVVGVIEAVQTGPSFEFDVAQLKGGSVDEWLVTVTNAGDTPAPLVVNRLSLEYIRPAKLRGTGSNRSYPRSLRAELAWSPRTADCGAAFVEIPPKARYAVLFRVRVDRRDGEFAVRYFHQTGRSSERCPYGAWRRADGPIPTLGPSSFVLARAKIVPWLKPLPVGHTPEDGAYLLTGLLRPGGEDARLPMFSHQGLRCASFRIRAFDKAGQEIRVASLVMCDDGMSSRNHGYALETPEAPHRLTDLAAAGLPVRVFFWARSRFSDNPIARIALEVLAANGVSRLPVSGPFHDSLHRLPPPFGPAHQGVRVRVRAVPGHHGCTEFYVEAVNDRDEPVKLISPSQPHTEVQLRLDGKDVPIFLRHPMAFGWAARHTCGERMELRLQPDPRLTLKPGRYTAEVTFQGAGGTHPNTSNEPIAVLKGELRTPKTVVVVR